MSKIPFTKLHHCGNDYVYIDLVDDPDLLAVNLGQQFQVSNNALVVDPDLRVCNELLSPFIKQTSHRSFGVGGDGVIFLCRVNSDENHEGQEAEAPQVRMRMFNADASESPMCGNGLMSIAALTVAHGHVRFPPRQLRVDFGIATNCGVTRAAVFQDPSTRTLSVELAVAVPQFDFYEIPCAVAASAPLLVEFFRDQMEFLVMRNALTPLPLVFGIDLVDLPAATMARFRHLLEIDTVAGAMTSIVDSAVTSVAEAIVERITNNIGISNNTAVVEKKTSPIGSFSLLANLNNCTATASFFSGTSLRFSVAAVGMGNPHAVVILQRPAGLAARPHDPLRSNSELGRVEEEEICRQMLDSFPIQELVAAITKTGVFPLGFNLSVALMYDCRKVDINNKSNTEDATTSTEIQEDVFSCTISMRTWERGSGPTLACGSGACATVVAASHLLCFDDGSSSRQNEEEEPAEEAAEPNDFVPAKRIIATVFQPGGRCRISYDVDHFGASSAVRMRGEPRFVFEGSM